MGSDLESISSWSSSLILVYNNSGTSLIQDSNQVQFEI